MALPSVVQLIEFQSGEIFERQSRGAGTYIQIAEIRGNSILSSIFVRSITAGATLKINYYDTTTSPELGQRFELVGHDIITDAIAPLTTLRTLVTRIHHKIVAEAIVTGGAIDFSLYATVVSSTASDLDSALNLDGATWDPATDKGLAVMCLDRTTGILDFLPCEDGALKVTGTVDTVIGSLGTVKSLFAESLALASNASVDIITYTVPPATTAYLILGEVSGTNIATFDVKLNGTIIARTRTYFGGDFAKAITFGKSGADGLPIVAGDVIKITVTNFRPVVGDFEARLQYVEV